MVLTAVDNLAAARRTAVDDSDDDDVKMTTTKRGGRRRVIVEDDDEDSESEEEQENEATLSIVVDDEEEAPLSSRDRDAARPPRPAGGPSRPAPPKQQAPRRRRRRSSARFLRLTGRYDGEEAEEEDEATFAQNDEHLGEMYKRAIRMNAENRINAGNSWGLRLIENIDKFLVDEEAETQETSQEEQEKRVNFTKASCTLDASVKIYSYRVDDVHLTSYKVLANLNRTETGKKKDNSGTTQEGDDDETQQTTTRSNERRGTTETLESNVANINISKLDSAYDIDPLFHKMSKTFDEGGAKGLLLVNLGVGSSGCNIVFDSKEQAASIAQDEKEEEPEESTMQEGMIDISSLNTKLENMLNGASIESIPLVPQLRDLRHEYEQLEAEGFVDHNIPKTRSRRYAASQDEEKEAEMSIHQEAMERSRASQVTFAQHEAASQGGDSFAPDDFGGGDDDDDFGFTDFVAADENGARYSSISFQDEGGGFIDDTPPGFETQQPNTSVLLDAICSSNALGGNNDYEFFDAEKLTTGNVWAGAAHWKKTERLRRNKQETTKKKKAKSKKKKTTKRGTLVDLSKPPCLDDVLHAPPKSKRGTDPLQLSKAMKTKYAKQDNLLPPDAGIGIEQLSTLFLRPNTVLGSKGENDEDTRGSSKKTVGFNTTVESFGGGFDYGGDDDSFGGGDDGIGFELADSSNDDFVINELEGVRKVDKIKVGYATVAKKVDVKRLKKDLWSELETSFAPAGVEEKDPDDDDASMDEDKPPATPVKKETSLSFKNTVRDMEASQSQGDVTLPFYFICLLHLANEKGLRLESTGLEDFTILQEADAAPSFGTIPETEPRKARAVATYNEEMLESSSSDEEETESETSE